MPTPYYVTLHLVVEGFTVCSETDDGSSRVEAMKSTCRQCGAHCCTYGGAVATALEVRAVVELGHPNHFERLSDNVFVTSWGDDGVCPYLNRTTCEIYDVRPLRCRAYPVVQMSNGEIVVANCPLLPYLKPSEIRQRSSLLSRCPSESVRHTARFMERHHSDLEMRSSRFEKMSVDEALAMLSSLEYS